MSGKVRYCLWDNNQNILHKLLIIILWFLSFLLKKFRTTERLSRTSTFFS